MEYREINYCPGLYKIFDEILVNATDEVQRNKSVKCIKIDICDKYISVYNDSGIPIEIHPEYDIYIPELIFANLLTSSNYDDDSGSDLVQLDYNYIGCVDKHFDNRSGNCHATHACGIHANYRPLPNFKCTHADN